MGFFGRKPLPPQQPSLEEWLGGDPNKQHDRLHVRFMDFVSQGLANSEIDSTQLRQQLSEAISALIWESFESRDFDIVLLLQRLCASYEVAVNDEITDAEWGQWLFDDMTPIFQYRKKFLAQGSESIERHLSLIAVTQGQILKLSPKYESVMAGVQAAAKAHEESRNHGGVPPST